MLTDDDKARDRRLLCAANLSYDIAHPHLVRERSDREKRSSEFYRAGCGLKTFQSFISGWEFADAALLGVNDNEIILAFRGTQPLNWSDEGDFVDTLADWIHDFDADLVEDRTAGPADWILMPGHIHRGFLISLKGHAKHTGLWPQIKPALQALIERFPSLPICITGHSKGGALSHLAAMQCATLVDPDQIYVCTFAAPRVGDHLFAEAYAQSLLHSYRYEYHLDVVPLLPPSHGFYASIAHHPAAHLFTMPERGYAPVGAARAVADLDAPAHTHTPVLNCLARVVKGEGRLVIEYHSSFVGHHYAQAVGLDDAIDMPSDVSG
jgi:hypothetical protein